MATMTFLMSRKIENLSVPGRNRKNRKEQERMNLTSIWRIRLGSSMKTMYVQIETKAIGRRVSKAADNDKLKWSSFKLHSTSLGSRIVDAPFGWLTQSKGAKIAEQSRMKNSIQKKPKVSPSTCKFNCALVLALLIKTKWTTTGPVMKASGTAMVSTRNFHVGVNLVTQASAPSDSTKSCKEMKSKADKIARKGSSATEDKHLNTIIRILESKAQSKCYRKGNSHDSHATDNFFNQLWNEEKEKTHGEVWIFDFVILGVSLSCKSSEVEVEYTSERWSLDRWFSCRWHFTSKAAQGGGRSFKRESTYVTRKNWPKEMFQHFGHASHTWRAASMPNISIYPSATASSSHDLSRLFSLLSFSQLSTCLNLHNLEVSWLDFLWWPINLSTYHYWMLLDTRGTP